MSKRKRNHLSCPLVAFALVACLALPPAGFGQDPMKDFKAKAPDVLKSLSQAQVPKGKSADAMQALQKNKPGAGEGMRAMSPQAPTPDQLFLLVGFQYAILAGGPNPQQATQTINNMRQALTALNAPAALLAQLDDLLAAFQSPSQQLPQKHAALGNSLAQFSQAQGQSAFINYMCGTWSGFNILLTFGNRTNKLEFAEQFLAAYTQLGAPPEALQILQRLMDYARKTSLAAQDYVDIRNALARLVTVLGGLG